MMSSSSSSCTSSSQSEYSSSSSADEKTTKPDAAAARRGTNGPNANIAPRGFTTSSDEDGLIATTKKLAHTNSSNLANFQKKKNPGTKYEQAEMAGGAKDAKDASKKEGMVAHTATKEMASISNNTHDRKTLSKINLMARSQVATSSKLKKHQKHKKCTLSRGNSSTMKKMDGSQPSISGSINSCNDSTTTSESEASDSSNSTTPRKLRMSMRHTKQLRNTGCGTESDSEMDAEKFSAKSPAKKLVTTTKCKAKKDYTSHVKLAKPRSLSPAQQTEKKCPIEGCDSSGHLSGNLEKHFLPEACPIFHNMSASECKERANERRLRHDHRLKMGTNVTPANVNSSSIGANSKILNNEQKEFLAKIRESRLLFKPFNANVKNDKVKLEKDCTDEDREPASLAGLVPDYDLQLFREAQAIASERIEDELKDLPFGKGIKYITMGKYKMKVWYQSPYPEDAARLPKLYICEFCLRYQKSEISIKRHALKCIMRHPPGDEIYRKGKLQVWQVDGKRHKQYCQHLCLLAKFFLDHKTLYYDVEPFLFYIMTLADVDGCHTVGYFSKEKNSFYNVSCILTLPPYQRKGYGRLLIDFSYLLTRVEGKIGSPEKPLSDLGLISYRSYWKDILLDYLCGRSGNTLSIKEVSQEMAIYSYDIVSTLQALGMMKYWKGKHIVLKKQDVLDEYEERIKHRGNFPKIDDTCLRWSPFVPPQTTNNSS